MASSLDRLILGRRSQVRDADTEATFIEGLVRDVTDAGMTFTVPVWDNGQFIFGPAPWPFWHNPTDDPNAGDHCLVLFLSGTHGRAWVLGWWPQ